MLKRERERVAAAARRLATDGLVLGTAGNVSEREPGGEAVAITPTGATLAELNAEDVAVVDLEGQQLAGELEPTSEIELHLGVYKRFDSGAVVHTHPPFGTTLACVLTDELPVVHYTMLLLGGAVKVAPYKTYGTPELAAVTLDALDGRAAALMANHGVIVHSHDLDAALDQSLLLEWACEVYWRAAAIGRPRALDEQQREAVISAAMTRGYGSTKPVDR